MVLKNNSSNHKKPTRLILVGLFILVTLSLFALYLLSRSTDSIIPELNSSSEINHDLMDHQNSLDTKSSQLNSKNTPVAIPEYCLQYKDKYKNLSEIKKQHQTNVRYQNLHKTIDGEVFRLRYFYKDGAEGERLQYLVYKENAQEEDILIETSPYKKGKQYLKVENALGEIIYFEEALTLGKDETPYLVFTNGQLTHYQENDIDCRF
jgi:hypothetical protein